MAEAPAGGPGHERGIPPGPGTGLDLVSGTTATRPRRRTQRSPPGAGRPTRHPYRHAECGWSAPAGCRSLRDWRCRNLRSRYCRRPRGTTRFSGTRSMPGLWQGVHPHARRSRGPGSAPLPRVFRTPQAGRRLVRRSAGRGEASAAFELAGSVPACLVIGTSARVYPAAGVPLATLAGGGMVVEVNPEPTPLTPVRPSRYAGRPPRSCPSCVDLLEVARPCCGRHLGTCAAPWVLLARQSTRRPADTEAEPIL